MTPRSRYPVTTALFATALALSVGAGALAETTGSLTGSIRDENGNPVGGFELVLEPQDNASTVAQRIKVNKKGRFVHRFLPTARYKVSVRGSETFLESMVYVIRDSSNLEVDRIESKAHPERGLPPVSVLSGQNGILDLVAASEDYRAKLSQQVAIAEASGDLKKASELLNSGQVEASLEKTEAILAAKPDLGAGLYLKGSALARMGRHDEAEAPLRQAVESIPEQPGIHATLADVLLVRAGAMRKDGTVTEEARELFAEAAAEYALELERDPDNEGVLRQRTMALRLSGDTEALRASLERLIEVVPQDPSAYMELARIALEGNDREAALAALERIPDKDRDVTTMMLNMAVSLYNDSRYDEAEPIVRRALELDPEFAELHRLDAGLRLVKGERDAAIAGLERYLELAAPDAPNVAAARQLLQGLKAAGGSAANQ